MICPCQRVELDTSCGRKIRGLEKIGYRNYYSEELAEYSFLKNVEPSVLHNYNLCFKCWN